MRDWLVTVGTIACAETPEQAASQFAEFLSQHSGLLTYQVVSMTGQIEPVVVNLDANLDEIHLGASLVSGNPT